MSTGGRVLVKRQSNYWKTLTPDVCTRYIDHLQKVLPDVNGGPSGH